MLNEETSPAIENTDDPAVAKKDDPAFLYFPTNYRWSMGLLICLSGAPWTGVEIDEVNRVGRALTDKVGDDDAWFEEWARMGDKIEARGRDADARRPQAHRGVVLHARLPLLPDRRALHSSALAAQHGRLCASRSTLFKEAAAHHPPPAHRAGRGAVREHEPAGAAGASGSGGDARPPAPAMVFFDGFDVTKELQYGYGVPDLAARGIGCLIVDGPGNGESVRFRNLPLIAETERYATPVYEYLAGRKEFDPKRIGVMALSLGGYYAPRAASLEQRFACCVAWGAQWDYHEIWARRLDLLDSGKVLSLSVPPEHLQWVLGVNDRASALKKLEGFRLDGIVQKMTCPFLLLHGAGDEQIPIEIAEKCFTRRSAPSRRRSKCSPARKAASIIARSTTPPSAFIICGIGSPTFSTPANER